MLSTIHNKLSDEIKQLDSQVNLNRDNPFPKSNFYWIISGGAGSGKTSLLLNMLKIPVEDGGFRKFFNNIFLISPTSRLDPKLEPLCKELERDGKCFEELNDEIISEIMDRIRQFNEDFKEDEKNKGKKPNSLVILDDCLASLPKSQKKSKLHKLIISRRHLKTSIVCLTQKYNAVPTLHRSNANVISFFPSMNKKEENSLMDDISVDEKIFRPILDFSTDEPFSFLHIKLGQGKPIFFKKFDKIIL